MKLKLYSITFYCCFVCVLFLQKINAQVTTQTIQQIQSLQKEKQSRTPQEQKIDSRLLQAVREKEGLRMAEGVDLEPANVGADNLGNLLIDIKADVTDELLSKIESLGGKIIFASAEYHSIRAKVNISVIRKIAAYNEVNFIEPAVPVQIIRNNNLQKNKNLNTQNIKDWNQKIREQVLCYLEMIKANKFSTDDETTGVVSEGDRTHRADDTRNTYGYSGEGIRIAVLSNSYNATKGASADIKKGELPGIGNPYGDTTAVTVVQDDPSGDDEGRAMLQIIHDLAPKAKLYFATADYGTASFATNIRKLAGAPYNCNIIVDDVMYLNEPPFEDGIIAQAVNQVTQNGVLYFSSAGNYGSLEKNTSAVFEGDFNDKGSLPFTGSTKKGSVHNFGTLQKPNNGDSIISFFPTTSGLSNRYILNWSDALGKSSNDYDLFLIRANGSVVSSSTNIQNGSQDPIELLQPTKVADGEKLVVFKDSTAQVRAIRLDAGFATYNGVAALSVRTAGQTFGHSSAVNAFAVAATDATLAYPNAFSSTDTVEDFSSDGPRHIFYNADSTAVTPGNFLFSTNGGTFRKKPDFTAADGVSTDVDSTTIFTPFYGTSAAAPHAGAIAALLKSADPLLTPAQIRTLLTGTALDIESAGYDYESGYGILQAFQAMQQLAPQPAALIELDSSHVTDGTSSNHNGFIEPGENGNIVVTLKNNSLANATSVTAVLSASTAGVTITKSNASFGTILAGGDTAANSASPFIIKLDTSIACGKVITFTLTVQYSGGKSSSQTFTLDVVAGAQPFMNIAATLGNPPAGAGYSVSTGTQPGRLGRYTTIGSTCDVPVPNPGINTAAGLNPRMYDAYVFTNNTTVSQCITTTLNASNTNFYCVAYNDSGFVPSKPAQHFLAEPQLTDYPLVYSFNVKAGKSFTVVVHEVDANTLHGVPYTLSVSLATCNNSALAVKMLKLAGENDEAKQQVNLNWTVAGEVNVLSYNVERSADGIHFSSISSTQASSYSTVEKTYQYIDRLPEAGDNYYRIKETDINGNTSYSNIVKITVNSIADVSIVPNPASSYININARSLMQQIQLLNASGQLLRTIKTATQNYRLQISSLPAGEYFLRIETSSNTLNKKFVKQ